MGLSILAVRFIVVRYSNVPAATPTVSVTAMATEAQRERGRE